MDKHERQQMILARQHLTVPADALTVCRDLNGLQAQFLSYTRHALAARCTAPLDEDWGGGLVKSWTIRGTMHVFREGDLPLFLHQDRKHFLRDVDQFTDDPYAPAERKALFSAHILSCIDRGITNREGLRDACRFLGMTEMEEKSFFNSWGGLFRAMAEAGEICYEVREEKRYRRCPAFIPMERDAALLEQARRYFTSFGPATVRDAAYFFGVSQRQVRVWLERLPVTPERCGDRECFFIGDEIRDLPEIPDCILLAGFDQLMLGYEKKESVFFEPADLRKIFSLSGIVLPCVLLNGQAAALWKRNGKRMELTAFREVSTKGKKAVEREVRRWFPETGEIRWI